ncbi:MAG: flagellar biosynthetic protein FliO [Phycisphaeraceae bacterium]|nr:flagellar biosynthetic protein FliO [Phycisphaeraceae bacterium]
MGRKHYIIPFAAMRAIVCGALIGVATQIACGSGPEPEEHVSAEVMPRATDVRGPTTASTDIAAQERRPLGVSAVEAKPLQSGREERTHGVASEARTLVVLGGIIVVIVGVAAGIRLIAKKHGGIAGACGPGGRAPAGVLSVLGRYPIARGQSLLLLQLDRRVILVGQTAGRGGARLATLAELSDPEDVASILVKTRDESGESVARKFREIVEKMSEPAHASERAVTVVPPIERADWFERVGGRRVTAARESAGGSEPVARPRPQVREQMAAVQVGNAGQARKQDGAEALRSRIEAIRRGGGR